MRNRLTITVLAIVGIVLLGTPAAAQTPAPKNLIVGFTFVAPGPGVGGTGGIEMPWKDAGGGTLTFVAGAGYLRSHVNQFAFGGGVKFTKDINEKAKFFVTVVAGAAINTNATGFGLSPSGGIIYNLNGNRNLYVSVGPGVTRKYGFAYWGTQITAGLIIPWD